MADYIDRQEAIEKLTNNLTYMHMFGADRSIDLIEEVPSADVQPVRRGRWIFDNVITKGSAVYGVRRCSECGSYYQDVGYGFHYCPSCGATMWENTE